MSDIIKEMIDIIGTKTDTPEAGFIVTLIAKIMDLRERNNELFDMLDKQIQEFNIQVGLAEKRGFERANEYRGLIKSSKPSKKNKKK